VVGYYLTAKDLCRGLYMRALIELLRAGTAELYLKSLNEFREIPSKLTRGNSK
jgi:hypothetical protein